MLRAHENSLRAIFNGYAMGDGNMHDAFNSTVSPRPLCPPPQLQLRAL